MPTWFSAPWSNNLKISSAIFVSLLLFGMAVSGRTGAIAAGVILLFSLLMVVRGYSVRDGRLIVHGLVWNKVYELRELCDVESIPSVTSGSMRVFGIGGLFSYWGYFQNNELGRYLSYVTDSANSVVLYFDELKVVVSPDDPLAFVEAVRHEYRRIRVQD